MMLPLTIGLLFVVLVFWILFIRRNSRRTSARARKNKPLQRLSLRL